MKKMIEVRDTQDKAYGGIVNSLLKYEDGNLEYYSDSDHTKRLLTNPDNKNNFKDEFDDSQRQWKNPFRDAYYWWKGEILDLKGLNECLIGRE